MENNKMESEKVRVIEKEEELCCKDKEIQEVISELINRKYPGLSLETERVDANIFH